MATKNMKGSLQLAVSVQCKRWEDICGSITIFKYESCDITVLGAYICIFSDTWVKKKILP